MKFLLLLIYNLIYPIYVLVNLPFYLVKSKRRGGLGRAVWERFGIYRALQGQNLDGCLYVHAVSVGEVYVGLKFIHGWLSLHGGQAVLSTTTPTGREAALAACIDDLHVIYSPIDLPFVVGRCLNRFKPQVVALVEAELWPNFARAAQKRGIKLGMVNARLSERSERRYKAMRCISRVLFSYLSAVGVQDDEDLARFDSIGVSPDVLHRTGSIKFDILAGTMPQDRPDFHAVIQHLRQFKPVILAASTHPGEEVAIAHAIRKIEAFPVIVPRHAERRDEVLATLTENHWNVVLRSKAPANPAEIPLTNNMCYVVDTTGELRDWMCCANVVVMGKSFLAYGGQNPVEAILAQVPVITGPHMENFATLMNLLCDNHGIIQVDTWDQLAEQMHALIFYTEEARKRAECAYNALHKHHNATKRSVEMIYALTAKPQ